MVSSSQVGSCFKSLILRRYSFFVSLLGAFILPIASDENIVMLYMILTVIIGWACLLTWAVLGSLFQEFLTKYNKPVSTIMALLLVYAAVSIFM